MVVLIYNGNYGMSPLAAQWDQMEFLQFYVLQEKTSMLQYAPVLPTLDQLKSPARTTYSHLKLRLEALILRPLPLLRVPSIPFLEATDG